MKDLLLLVSFVFLLFLNSFSQRNTYFFDDTQNNKVSIAANKILKEEVYDYSFNKDGIKDSLPVKTLYYDSSGNLIEEKSEKNKNFSESIRKYTYFFSSDGNQKPDDIDCLVLE